MKTQFEEMIDCSKHGFTPIAYRGECEECFYDDIARWGSEQALAYSIPRKIFLPNTACRLDIFENVPGLWITLWITPTTV